MSERLSDEELDRIMNVRGVGSDTLRERLVRLGAEVWRLRAENEALRVVIREGTATVEEMRKALVALGKKP